MKMLREWDELPDFMRTEEVRRYYDILKKKNKILIAKRAVDLLAAVIGLTILGPIMIVIAVLIARDSKGGVFFMQERITQYGRKFRIHKFRTMVADAEKLGSQVTVSNDMRVTKIGAVLRKYRLDELPQLLDILSGNMSLVGTRPETTRFVKKYTPEMFATLLLPAGVTSEASIRYKDEARLLEKAENADEVYVNEVLPEKMKYNLESIRKFGFFNDLKTMIKTVFAVIS